MKVYFRVAHCLGHSLSLRILASKDRMKLVSHFLFGCYLVATSVGKRIMRITELMLELG